MISSKFRKTYVVTGVIFLVIVTGHYTGFLRPLENFLRSAAIYPFAKSNALSVKISNKFEFFKNPDDLLNQYAACVQNLESKNVDESKVKLLEKENADLKKQLNFVEKNSTSTITLEVIGNDLVGTEKIITIGGGKKDDLKIGDAVIVGEGILVGKVIKTEDNFSIVRLISDNQSRVSSHVLNEDQSFGVVEGGYGISLRMKFVPRSETIHLNDQIVTSGLDGSFPRGLLIGKVIEVENEAYQGFQTISLMPATDLSKLTVVTVILNN